jgi:hypothetical protein
MSRRRKKQVDLGFIMALFVVALLVTELVIAWRLSNP